MEERTVTDQSADAEAEATRKRSKIRAGVLLAAAVAAIAIGGYLWVHAHPQTPAQKLQAADASDSHGHDLATYDAALKRLQPVCTDSAADLERFAENSEAMLQHGGITDTDRLAILNRVYAAIPASRPATNCDQYFATYLALTGVPAS